MGFDWWKKRQLVGKLYFLGIITLIVFMLSLILTSDYFINLTAEKLFAGDFQNKEAFYKHALEVFAEISFLIKLFIFVIVVIGCLIIAALLRSIVIEPLHALMDAFKKGSEGDLEVEMPGNRSDEIGQLFLHFNHFVMSLKEIISSIRKTSETIMQSSQEISNGNTQLSSSTHEMASSLQETAASVEEIHQSIHDTAAISVKLAENISRTAIRAEKGKEKLHDMELAVGEVKSSGDRIAEIVDLVNAIAFQTNLLALNAAVEAARAGEHGKGFAIVASEVRGLAMRTADAANEIKRIVEENGERIQKAELISRSTSQVLIDVVREIASDSGEMKDIRIRAEEQARGIKQINAALAQMDDVTQRNASLVEQLATSASDLATISKGLGEEIEMFRTGNDKALPAVKRDTERMRQVFSANVQQQSEQREKDTLPAKSTVPGHRSIEKPAASDFFDDDKFEEF